MISTLVTPGAFFRVFDFATVCDAAGVCPLKTTVRRAVPFMTSTVKGCGALLFAECFFAVDLCAGVWDFAVSGWLPEDCCADTMLAASSKATLDPIKKERM